MDASRLGLGLGIGGGVRDEIVVQEITQIMDSFKGG